VSDEAYMERALGLAERGWGIVSPNPLVGAVVLSADGRVVGEGWHEGPGTPHAEVVALRQAGEAARGSTLYSTLEPCNHVGRTPPCTDAIVEAGVALVVSALEDPNPIVDGRGYARLRDAGIEVREPILAERAARQNRAYVTHVRTGRPHVVWKAASSLDGKVAARDGSSRWVTGDAARADAHHLRAWSDAIVVGAGTAIADRPALTVREPGYAGRPPLRVVVDARGRVPATGPLFDDAVPTLVATTPSSPADVRSAWASAGAEVETFDATPEGDVPLDALTASLGKRDVQGVLLEGGPTLAWSAVAAGLVDEVVVYLAPKLVGGGGAPGTLGGAGFAPIANAAGLEITSFERVGEDLKVVADVHRDR
jgi:diaminohydroxyphosphoribosylaminopyrimidine deaminase/5-amino-6-(5-phosphoribosylamino)uracil reductase